MNIYQCNICTKTFKTQDALNGHMKVHGPSNGIFIANMCCSLLTKKNILVRNLENHDLKYISDNTMDNECKHCHSLIKRTQNFCNKSCQVKYTNSKRDPMTEETKNKISMTLSGSGNSRSRIIKKKDNITCTHCLMPFASTINKLYCSSQCLQASKKYSFSKLFMLTCAQCHTKFVNRRPVKYCNQHKDLYKSNNRNRYRFTFSLSKYPDIFSDYSSLLKEYGMWSPKNTSGLTRDHRVSVNEAIKNNYDPYYITHPLNCELMPWYQNNKKNTKCSLPYQELVSLVDIYDITKQ